VLPYVKEFIGDTRIRLDHDYADAIAPNAATGPIGTTLHGGNEPYDPSQFYAFRAGKMYNGLVRMMMMRMMMKRRRRRMMMVMMMMRRRRRRMMMMKEEEDNDDHDMVDDHDDDDDKIDDQRDSHDLK
jgi:hypothetical protein